MEIKLNKRYLVAPNYPPTLNGYEEVTVLELSPDGAYCKTLDVIHLTAKWWLTEEMADYAVSELSDLPGWLQKS